MAVTGNAPDFGKKLHEAFQSSQSYQAEPGSHSGYSPEPQYDQHQHSNQNQQQYYSQEEHYGQEQNYGSEMYGHQQGYTSEPYHQGYSQQYDQDSQYSYGQYGQDPNQGYSHGYSNENQHPDAYYDRDPNMGYQQHYSQDMESPYQQRQDWYEDSRSYYGSEGYYQWIALWIIRPVSVNPWCTCNFDVKFTFDSYQFICIQLQRGFARIWRT